MGWDPSWLIVESNLLKVEIGVKQAFYFFIFFLEKCIYHMIEYEVQLDPCVDFYG